MADKPRSLYVMPDKVWRILYNDDARKRVCELTRNADEVVSKETIMANPEAFADVEIIFSGWGAPKLNEAFLNALPSLKAFFYSAGSVRDFVSDAFWERDILLTSAYKANAIPVAEFTFATIILALKRVWHFNSYIRVGEPHQHDDSIIAGAYHGTRVGIISLGAIGRLVCEKLLTLDVEVLAYDPFAEPEVFESLQLTRVDDLESLFAQCDVVSLHAPWLKATEGLVTEACLRKLREGATFINTARPAIVDEPALVRVLKERRDLQAILDVVEKEHELDKSPLARLPNAFVTPHIAGSKGRECFRMGALAVEECRRYLAGEPALTPLTKATAALLA